MIDKIQNFRQPMVTATSLVLGFILNVTANWASMAFKPGRYFDLEIAISLVVCIILLVVVLYRLLKMNYPKDKAETYYKRTLLLFIIGIIIPFFAILVLKIESLILDRA